MDRCERFMKYLLFTVNIIILIFGTIVIIGSVYGLVAKPSSIEETGNNQLDDTFIVSLIVGIFISSTSIFGIVAALRETKCMLLTYFIIVSLLLVLGIVSGIRQYNSNKEIMKLFEEEMENTLQFYNDKKFIRNFWDTTQSKYQCCGINSWKDWETHGLKVPDSCCESSQQLHCNENISKVYAKGCINELQGSLQYIRNLAHGIITTLLCLMVLGKISSYVLYRAQRIKQQFSAKTLIESS